MNKKTILIVCICAAAVLALLLVLNYTKKPAPAAQSPAAASESASPSASASPAAAASAAPGANTPVSADSRQSFEKLLNEGGNYGFLLSQYSDVRSADLTQVLYVGADIEPASDAQAIVDAYNAALGSDAPQTDCTVLKTPQIDSFLKEKTGYTLKEMKNGLDWEYDPNHDAYLLFHGDTNQVPIKVASGKALGGDKYELTCTFGNVVYDAAVGAAEGCIVTLELKNGKPVFLSNTLTA